MQHILRRAVLAAAAALAFNAVLRTVVKHWAHVPDAFDPFTWPPVLIATIVGVTLGTVVYLALRKFLPRRADRVFAWVGYGVLVLSLITPVTLLWSDPPQYPGTSLVTVLALELMHLSTGIATVVALTWRARRLPSSP